MRCNWVILRAHDRIDSFVHSNASPEPEPEGLNTVCVFACTTCPLYRQLNLEHELCWNGEWKKNIVMFETGILNGVKSENLKDVQTEISALQQEDEINTTQKLFEAIYLKFTRNTRHLILIGRQRHSRPSLQM
mmetsp:Transcript_3481/g.5142  ORF Transcript_3481/g.5142 Transcript_3481/m.5142 type:complete len:133 (-) Transcript_3481:349-747(-)